MNKSLTLLTISVAAAFAAAPCLASEPDTQQTVALLGSQPAAPAAASDSAVKKAIQELIKRQQKQYIDIQKKIPVKLDNPVGEQHPLRNPNLIIGGAEAIPM